MKKKSKQAQIVIIPIKEKTSRENMLKITKGGYGLLGAVREDFSVVLTYKLRPRC